MNNPQSEPGLEDVHLQGNDRPPRSATDPVSKTKLRPSWLNMLLFLLGIGGGALVYFLLPRSVPEAPRRMAAIFAMAVLLWVTEGIPLFATSLLVLAIEIWWLARPDHLGITMSYESVFAAASHPIIFLFLGGLILARAVQQHGIDVQMAALLMRPFGTRPGGVLAGVMTITALFSMWMGNTATTAMMIVMVMPLVRQISVGDPFRRALVLSVPFAASAGGIGTPIGTPPNAIALAQLEARGLTINFFQWMTFGIPLVILTLGAVWSFLMILYRSHNAELHVRVRSDFVWSQQAVVVYLCFLLTVGLWLTSPLHGIPTSVVAIVPVALLTTTRLIGRREFNRLDWDILFLIAGGIALGNGLTITGLDKLIVSSLPAESLGFRAVMAIFCIVVVLMGSVMSHTVATNILLPISLGAISSFAQAGEFKIMAVLVALCASFAVALPISTPPNTIAYGTGEVSARDIMRVGVITSVVGTSLIVLTGPWVVGLILKWLG